MITEGQIVSIQDRTCSVRIPLFETVGSNIPTVVTAPFSCPPGVYGGFKAGDTVWLAFERELADKPVVIGRIYAGSSTGGAVDAEVLSVSGSASLPADTAVDGRPVKLLVQDIDRLKSLDTAAGCLISIQGKLEGEKTFSLILHTARQYPTYAALLAAIKKVKTPYPAYDLTVGGEYIGATGIKVDSGTLTVSAGGRVESVSDYSVELISV